jgi:hypothetical protein
MGHPSRRMSIDSLKVSTLGAIPRRLDWVETPCSGRLQAALQHERSSIGSDKVEASSSEDRGLGERTRMVDRGVVGSGLTVDQRSKWACSFV